MKKLLFYFITFTMMIFNHSLYATWYSCPSASSVVDGNYAPFILCSGKTENTNVHDTKPEIRQMYLCMRHVNEGLLYR